MGPRSLEPVTLEQMGQFLSDCVYLVQYSYRRQTLDAELEHLAFVWVGADVGRGKSGGVAVGGVHLQQAIRHLKRLSRATAQDPVRRQRYSAARVHVCIPYLLEYKSTPCSDSLMTAYILCG